MGRKMEDTDCMEWSNPHDIDLTLPFIYFIRVTSPQGEYRYIGKGSSRSRMDAYARNVTRVLAGQPKRPAVKRNGEPQSSGNIKFRYVHLVLATAVKKGWKIEHYPIENCEKSVHSVLESQRKREQNCNMNDGDSWFVEDFELLSNSIK